MANDKNKKEVVSEETVAAAVQDAAESEHPQDDAPVVESDTISTAEDTVDKDGYIVLEPSDAGKKLEQRWQAGKITNTPFTMHPETELDKLEDLLGSYTIAAKNGEYDAIDPTKEQMSDIREFIANYHPEEKDVGTQGYAIAKMILMIGKSVYEYAPDHAFIDDMLYDALMASYKKYHVEPTGIVPSNVPGREKIQLRFPTLSNNLDKAYRIMETDELPTGVKEEDSIEAFLKRTFANLNLNAEKDHMTLILSPKIDGVSVNAMESEGRFTTPASRGDSDSNMRLKGLEGYRIIRTKEHEPIAIQYEAFVTKDNKQKAAEALEHEYVNCRSCASGLINRMSADPKAIKYSKFLHFYPINAEMTNKPYVEKLVEIDKFGKIPKDMPPRKAITGNLSVLLDEIKKEFAHLEDIRKTLSFEIDGMVISIADDEQQELIGRTGRTNLWQIAMKFNPASAIGYVDNISISYGNKGKRTIMINLKEPAVIDGVEYPTIPVLSTRSFDGLDLRVGSKIKVIRTGDVIPSFEVMEHGNGKLLKKPTTCPACGGDLTVEESGHLRCDNALCPKNVVGRFITMFEMLGLDNYDEEFATKLMNDAKIDNLSNLLDLTTKKLNAAGISGKLEDEFVPKLHSTLENTPDYKILASLGFPGISKERSKAILSVIDFDKIDDMTVEQVKETLEAAAGFKKMAEEFAITLVANKDLIKKWLATTKKAKTNFDNLVVIGHSGLEFPPEVEKKILDHGWDITDGRRFDLLVIPDINYTSRKTAVAVHKNILMITMEELMDSIDNLDTVFQKNLTPKEGVDDQPSIELPDQEPVKMKSPDSVIILGPSAESSDKQTPAKKPANKSKQETKPPQVESKTHQEKVKKADEPKKESTWTKKDEFEYRKLMLEGDLLNTKTLIDLCLSKIFKIG